MATNNEEKKEYNNNIYDKKFDPSPEFHEAFLQKYSYLLYIPRLPIPQSMVKVIEAWCDNHIVLASSDYKLSFAYLYSNFDPASPAHIISQDDFNSVLLKKYSGYILYESYEGDVFQAIDKHRYRQDIH
jgi:hypothetical protein